MRITCLECVRKHLGEAVVAMEESFSGYPHHAMYAVGALSHAASESLLAYPQLAARIRDIRLAYEQCHGRVLMGETLKDVAENMPDMDALAQEIHELILTELMTDDVGAEARSVRQALGLKPKEQGV